MAEGDLRWKYNFGTKQYSGIITDSNGVVYFGTGNFPANNYIYAINPDGTLKWRYAAGARVWSGLALSNDESIVYCGCNREYLCGIYTATGLLKFNYTHSANALMSGIAVDSSDKIYFGNANELVSLNYDGTLNWAGYGPLFSDLTIKNNKLYCVFESGNLFKINLDGSEVWHTSTAAVTYGSGVPIAADGTIYFGGLNNYAYAINPDGTTKWSYDAGGNIDAAIAIGSNNNIWFGISGEVYKIMVLRPSDGSLVWDYTLSSKMGSGYSGTTGLVLNSNNIIYTGCWDDKLYAINSDGTLRWSYTTGGNIESGIAFSPSEDTVYFASHDGYLYAIEAITCGKISVGDKVFLLPIGNFFGNVVALKSDVFATSDRAFLASLDEKKDLKLAFKSCTAAVNDKVICLPIEGLKENIVALR